MTNFLCITAAVFTIHDTNWIGGHGAQTNIGGTNYAIQYAQPATNHWILFVHDNRREEQPFRCDVGTINSNIWRLIGPNGEVR